MSHGRSPLNLSANAITDDGRLATFGRRAFGIGLIAFAIAIFIGWKQGNPAHFAKVYLVNFIFVLAISLGGLAFTMIHHITNAGWSAVVRRTAEAQAANLRWLWILALPMAWLWFSGRSHDGHSLGLDLLWPWANLEHIAEHNPAEAVLLEQKSAYLNADFFMLRAVIYFATWALLANFYFGKSVRQDAVGGEAESLTLRKWTGPAVLLFAFTTTFASVDWIMSLNPTWFSTMFGVYFFCVCFTAGFSSLAIALIRQRQLGFLEGVVTKEHFQDLGKFIFAFGVVFWAYIAFCQYMLVWYGNIPEETTWYAARQLGDWAWLSTALFFGHFLIPFVFLISRWIKRWPATLLFGAVWMLAFGWIDVWYLVMPVVPADIGSFDTYNQLATAYANESTGLGNMLNYVLLAAMLFMLAGSTMMRLARVGLVCRSDPRLAESISFQNA